MKQANPVIWGAIGAIGVTALVGVSAALGYRPVEFDGNLSVQIGGGFFWGAVCAYLWNWSGKRRS